MHAEKQVSSDHRDTRERLLAASLSAFGQRHYDAVSTREIVETAGANIASISYHFGGKQALYLATAEYLADNLRNRMQSQIEAIMTAVPTASKQQCRSLLGTFIARLVDTLLQGNMSEDATGFIFREQLQPTAAFDILFERLMLPMQTCYAALVGAIRNTPADSRETLLTTHALMGQIIAFRAARTTILRRLGQYRLGPEDAKEIARMITELTLNSLEPAGKPL